MIRHRGALFAPLPVVALAVAMIEPPFRAALMTLIGPPPLLSPRPFATGLAAITMSTVAVRAQEKGRQAVHAETGPLHQYRFMRRPVCPQARLLDTGTRSCQPRPVCWVSPSRR